MKPLDLPRIGRYRLYDLVPPNHVRCRLCRGRALRRDNAWEHYWRKHMGLPETVLEEALRIVLLRRRSRRHRAHAQFEHETGGRFD